MRRAELRVELERLGQRPVPLPDPQLVDAIEGRLYEDFVVTASPYSGSALPYARRRLVVVAGLSAAAAATMAVVALHRAPSPGYELQAATGAIALFPTGESRPVHAGDQIPPGGLIQTGPSGGVTIDGTKVGPDQIVLMSEEGLTLLPAHHEPSPDLGTATVPAPTTAAAPVRTSASAPTVATTLPSAAEPLGTAAPPPESAVDPVPSSAEVAPPSAADPALFAAPLAEIGLVVSEDGGGVHLSWTASADEGFSRYAVARGTAADHQLQEIASFGDRQITSFTDPAAPHDVALLYQVVAVSADGRPVARSEVVELALQDGTGTGTATTEVPSSTDGSGVGLTVPRSTGNPSTPEPTTSTGPDTTADSSSSTSPETTTASDPTSAPTTASPTTTAPAAAAPPTATTTPTGTTTPTT
jgi:hypothetical protein